MPLDMQQSWYRYHHLFGELLQMRLRQRFPEMTDELHLRASRWYAKRGAFEQAIDHALQTSTRDEALELLDKQAGMTLLTQSKVRTYRRLVDQLPESRIQEYPMILVGRAWADMLSMRTTDLEQDITRVQKALNSPGCAYSPERRSRVKAFLQALEAYNLQVSGQLKQAIDLSRESVLSVPEELLLVRALLRYNMARAYMQMGYIREPKELLQAVQDALHIEQSPYLRVGVAGHIGYLEVQDRGPVAAQERLEHALQGVRNQEMEQLPVVSYLHRPLGYAKYLANDIDGAQEHLTHAVELRGVPDRVGRNSGYQMV